MWLKVRLGIKALLAEYCFDCSRTRGEERKIFKAKPRVARATGLHLLKILFISYFSLNYESVR